MEDGIAIDYDAANRLAGIDILDAAQRLVNEDSLCQVVFENGADSEATDRNVAAP